MGGCDNGVTRRAEGYGEWRGGWTRVVCAPTYHHLVWRQAKSCSLASQPSVQTPPCRAREVSGLARVVWSLTREIDGGGETRSCSLRMADGAATDPKRKERPLYTCPSIPPVMLVRQGQKKSIRTRSKGNQIRRRLSPFAYASVGRNFASLHESSLCPVLQHILPLSVSLYSQLGNPIVCAILRHVRSSAPQPPSPPLSHDMLQSLRGAAASYPPLPLCAAGHCQMRVENETGLNDTMASRD